MKTLILAALLSLLLLSACGPATYQQIKGSWRPLPDENREQVVDAIRMDFLDEQPGKMMVSLQRCDMSGRYKYDPNGYPYTEPYDVSVAADLWQQIRFTNNTQHVVRLTDFRVRIFDPSGVEYGSVEFDGLKYRLTRLRDNCPPSAEADGALRAVKLFTTQTEIVPGGSTSGYLAFNPTNPNVPGTWRIAIYGLPAELDAAGKVLKLRNVEYRIGRTKIVETYQRDMLNPLADPVMLNREEVLP